MFFSKRKEPVSWIIVFLGNPGVRYENTRHNVGFMTADVIAKNYGFKITKFKFKSLTATAALGGQTVFLLKPQTYMNLSGQAVRQAMRYYDVPLSNVLVITDDVSLPTGKLRVRRQGSAGGHNGLQDIIDNCGGESYPRIKIGVGKPPHEDFDMADWVLSRFSEMDSKIIDEAIKQTAIACEAIIAKGIDFAMGEFN